MVTRRALLKRSAASVAVAGATAGCLGGAGGGGGSQPADGGSTGTPTGSAPTVTVRTHPDYGDILADANGMTLYLFTKDGDGESACYEGCAESWPPLTVEGEPTAGEGVTADLGTAERRDGSRQVTAAGNPLYYFARDGSPGDAEGQGVGDVWYVLDPDGSKVAGSGETTAASGGYY